MGDNLTSRCLMLCSIVSLLFFSFVVMMHSNLLGNAGVALLSFAAAPHSSRTFLAVSSSFSKRDLTAASSSRQELTEFITRMSHFRRLQVPQRCEKWCYSYPAAATQGWKGKCFWGNCAACPPCKAFRPESAR